MKQCKFLAEEETSDFEKTGHHQTGGFGKDESGSGERISGIESHLSVNQGRIGGISHTAPPRSPASRVGQGEKQGRVQREALSFTICSMWRDSLRYSLILTY